MLECRLICFGKLSQHGWKCSGFLSRMWKSLIWEKLFLINTISVMIYCLSGAKFFVFKLILYYADSWSQIRITRLYVSLVTIQFEFCLCTWGHFFVLLLFNSEYDCKLCYLDFSCAIKQMFIIHFTLTCVTFLYIFWWTKVSWDVIHFSSECKYLSLCLKFKFSLWLK